MIYDVEQGSDEWLQARCGMLTASRMCEILAVKKDGKPTAARESYLWEIVAERMTGAPAANTAAFAQRVRWGTEHEPEARRAYEMLNGVCVERIGFAVHPRLDFSGGSPDFLVGHEGVAEVKCPDSITHLKWMLSGVVPREHEPQMYWNMACTEREWEDFVSYDPRQTDERMQLFIRRLPRDEEKILAMELVVTLFESEINATVTKLREAL